MSAIGYYEDQLNEAMENLVRAYRTFGGLTKEDAFRRLNKLISDQTNELQMNARDD